MRLKYQFQTGALLSMSLFFFSCQEQTVCKNLNPVLNDTDFNSANYKKTVKEAIETLPEGSVSYYLDRYYVKDGNEYLVAEIKSKDVLCAKAEFQIKPGVFLANIPRTKGIGYRGAELKGLQFESKQKANTVILMIDKIESIVD
jgi:hypothetical protein